MSGFRIRRGLLALIVFVFFAVVVQHELCCMNCRRLCNPRRLFIIALLRFRTTAKLWIQSGWHTSLRRKRRMETLRRETAGILYKTPISKENKPIIMIITIRVGIKDIWRQPLIWNGASRLWMSAFTLLIAARKTMILMAECGTTWRTTLGVGPENTVQGLCCSQRRRLFSCRFYYG